MNYLLDTCVVSELVAARPNARVLQWVESIPEERLYLSVITLGEIQKGIGRLAAGARRQRLEEWLHNDLMLRFQDRLVALDAAVLLAWGQLASELERAGKPLPAMDGLIAASVIQRGMTLATRNVTDFQPAGLPLVNPWEG